MKAKLKFNLKHVDDRMSHYRCVKSNDMAIVLFEVIHNLKKRMIVETTPTEYIEGVEDTINQIYELCQDNGIDIDKLTG